MLTPERFIMTLAILIVVVIPAIWGYQTMALVGAGILVSLRLIDKKRLIKRD